MEGNFPNAFTRSMLTALAKTSVLRRRGVPPLSPSLRFGSSVSSAFSGRVLHNAFSDSLLNALGGRGFGGIAKDCSGKQDFTLFGRIPFDCFWLIENFLMRRERDSLLNALGGRGFWGIAKDCSGKQSFGFISFERMNRGSDLFMSTLGRRVLLSQICNCPKVRYT